MSAATFFATFGLIFVAELGDKTQLAAVVLAARYPWHRVFAGAAAAFVVLNLAAVAVGQVLFAFVPERWILLASAALFAFFGVSAFLGKADDPGRVNRAGGSPVLATFLVMLLAELGDKTQFATASLAAQHQAPLEVFAGSTLALWLVCLLGVAAGAKLMRYLPVGWLHRVAGALFLLFAAGALHRAVG